MLSTYNTCTVNGSFTTCGTGKHLSNGHCCPTGTYWENSVKKCLKLFDANCDEASSQTTCTKCKTNYTLDTNITARVRYETSLGKKQILLNICVKNEYKVANAVLGNQIYDTLRNCWNYDKTNLKCLNCDSTYNLIGNYCC